jgi:hypothetical protein
MDFMAFVGSPPRRWQIARKPLRAPVRSRLEESLPSGYLFSGVFCHAASRAVLISHGLHGTPENGVAVLLISLGRDIASAHISRASRGPNPLRSSRPIAASLCLANAACIHLVSQFFFPRSAFRVCTARALTCSDESPAWLPSPLLMKKLARTRFSLRLA